MAEGIQQAQQLDWFADFNGLPEGADRTDFYEHDANWSNRMILGDSLQVMASLAEREGLRGKVQCIYIDPPYGIKFNSNFQWSTKGRNAKGGTDAEHITREPEQVRAFQRYLARRHPLVIYHILARSARHRPRLLLLSTSRALYLLQIGDENVHRRAIAVMDEVFGA